MNNNKMDGQNKIVADGLRVRSVEPARNADKKHLPSVFLVDLLLLIAMVGVIFLLVLAFTPLSLFGGDGETRQIVYTIELCGVDQDMEYAFREGDIVTDAQTGKELGVITRVNSRVYEAYIDTPTEEISPEFDKYVVQKQRNEEWRVITVSIRATADYQPGVGYTVQSERIAVGRDYQLRFPTYTYSGACVSLAQATEEGTVSD